MRQITVEPRLMVTLLLWPLFFGPAKQPYISLQKKPFNAVTR